MVRGTNDITSEYLPGNSDEARLDALEHEVEILRMTCQMMVQTIRGALDLLDLEKYFDVRH